MPPRSELSETGANATWLARHGRSDLPETGASETWLVCHGEQRADPLGGTTGEAEPLCHPVRVTDQGKMLPVTQARVDALAGRAAGVTAQVAFKHREAN